MRLLVTNDDGIEAPGIHALAAALVDAGHDVIVAAPMVEMSGSGAAIGIMSADTELLVAPADIPGRPDIEAYGVDGPPALAVMAARLGAFGAAPELVASGINPGHNTGRAMLHSGTVGAALTAANFGVSALAVSTGVGPNPTWATAADLAVAAVDWLDGEPVKTVLNLNVPDVSLDALRGVRWAEPAAFGTVQATLVDMGDHRLRMTITGTEVELA
ncbi:MAG: 5'/3'-nucleotidase SurE, partial [Actinomycetota bacterium]|nr:5'/3'-nucleotidase SurE [Actinomycetota bacterium]